MRALSCHSLLSRSCGRTATFRKAPARTLVTSGKEFAEGEIILIRDVLKEDKYWLSSPLQIGRRINTHIGTVEHGDIIRKAVRSKIETSKGRFVRALRPTLDEYTRLSPRLVTPIYPQAANIIVSLLDIHIPRAEDGSSDPSSRTEILESGTGHGSLTLQLARAIHAANPPPVLFNASREWANAESPTTTSAEDQQVEEWKEKLRLRARKRNAVVHTVEISDRYSKLANRFVKSFRNGIYYGDVDFHVGCVSDWIRTQFEERGSEEAFLDHVLLDMPNAANHLALGANALKANGCLTVFFPSITQVTKCFTKIKRNKLPLWLDRVIEIDNSTAGGKYWDVRLAQIRANATINEVPRNDQSIEDDEKEPDLICRPEFGFDRLGTCFVGLFRRMAV